MIHSNILTFIGYSAEAKFSEYISLQHPIVTVYRFQMDIVFLLSPIEREKKSHRTGTDQFRFIDLKSVLFHLQNKRKSKNIHYLQVFKFEHVIFYYETI